MLRGKNPVLPAVLPAPAGTIRRTARAGIAVGGNLVASHPDGFANIAVTPGEGCVFSWAKDAAAGLRDYTAYKAIAAPARVRMTRIGSTYVGSCSADGVNGTVVGSAIPGGIGATADVGMFASAANGGSADRLVARFDSWSLAPGAGSGDKRIAIEYFHAAFRHYFVTAIPDEIAKLDVGMFAGWSGTGEAFNVYAKPGAGRVPVCRFFTVAFPPTSSHFYSRRGLDCEAAFANRDWQFEGDVFHSPLPGAAGRCPSGTQPVYRLYNDGQGGAPNHRFTTSASVRAEMLASGYIAEGAGNGVGFCAPQ